MKTLRLIAALALVAGVAAPEALADGRNKSKATLAGKPAAKPAPQKAEAKTPAPEIRAERTIMVEEQRAPGPVYVTSLDGIGTGGVGYTITGDTGRSSSRIYFLAR